MTEIIFDLGMALRILGWSQAEYERIHERGIGHICTKSNLEKIKDELLNNFSRYYGVELGSIECDRDHMRKNLNKKITQVLKNKKNFIIGHIPQPSSRSRPKCKYFTVKVACLT